MSAFTIYGDSISGNCLKVKWVARYLGLSFDWREVSVERRETREEPFLAINPAGQVPVVVFADGRKLAQSNAIIRYLADCHAGNLTPTDRFDEAKMNEWLYWEQYSHETAIAVRRFHKGILKKAESDIDPSLLTRGQAALNLMNKSLDGRPYFVGDALSLADVALVAYTRVADEGGFALDDYPNVRAWISRIESDLAIDPAEGRIS